MADPCEQFKDIIKETREKREHYETVEEVENSFFENTKYNAWNDIKNVIIEHMPNAYFEPGDYGSYYFLDEQGRKQQRKIGKMLNKKKPFLMKDYLAISNKQQLIQPTVEALAYALENRVKENPLAPLVGEYTIELPGDYHPSIFRTCTLQLSQDIIDIVLKSHTRTWQDSSCENIGREYGNPKTVIEHYKNVEIAKEIIQKGKEGKLLYKHITGKTGYFNPITGAFFVTDTPPQTLSDVHGLMIAHEAPSEEELEETVNDVEQYLNDPEHSDMFTDYFKEDMYWDPSKESRFDYLDNLHHKLLRYGDKFMSDVEGEGDEAYDWHITIEDILQPNETSREIKAGFYSDITNNNMVAYLIYPGPLKFHSQFGYPLDRVFARAMIRWCIIDNDPRKKGKIGLKIEKWYFDSEHISQLFVIDENMRGISQPNSPYEFMKLAEREIRLLAQANNLEVNWWAECVTKYPYYGFTDVGMKDDKKRIEYYSAPDIEMRGIAKHLPENISEREYVENQVQQMLPFLANGIYFYSYDYRINTPGLGRCIDCISLIERIAFKTENPTADEVNYLVEMLYYYDNWTADFSEIVGNIIKTIRRYDTKNTYLVEANNIYDFLKKEAQIPEFKYGYTPDGTDLFEILDELYVKVRQREKSPNPENKEYAWIKADDLEMLVNAIEDGQMAIVIPDDNAILEQDDYFGQILDWFLKRYYGYSYNYRKGISYEGFKLWDGTQPHFK